MKLLFSLQWTNEYVLIETESSLLVHLCPTCHLPLEAPHAPVLHTNTTTIGYIKNVKKHRQQTASVNSHRQQKVIICLNLLLLDKRLILIFCFTACSPSSHTLLWFLLLVSTDKSPRLKRIPHSAAGERNTTHFYLIDVTVSYIISFHSLSHFFRFKFVFSSTVSKLLSDQN